jgi:hypothetical protein
MMWLGLGLGLGGLIAMLWWDHRGKRRIERDLREMQDHLARHDDDAWRFRR